MTLADLDRLEALHAATEMGHARVRPDTGIVEDEASKEVVAMLGFRAPYFAALHNSLPALLRLARLGVAAEKEKAAPAGMVVTDCRECRNEDYLHHGRLLCADETFAVHDWIGEAAWNGDYSVATAPTLCPGFKPKENDDE